jgi:transposase
VSEHPERLQRLEQERKEHGSAWRFSPRGAALQVLRGVHWTVAVPRGADMGDLPRFESPRELRKFLGLMPSEPSSGEPRRPGSLTKAGNTHARRVLGAGAWAYR